MSEIAIQACWQNERGRDCVASGWHCKELRPMALPAVEFHVTDCDKVQNASRYALYGNFPTQRHAACVFEPPNPSSVAAEIRCHGQWPGR